MQYYLEFFVAGLGLVLLLWEAFAAPEKKSKLALFGVLGLTLALAYTVLNASCACAVNQEAPAWMARFYSNGPYSYFFKGFALLSTIFVLLMSYDFSKVINKFTSPDGSDTNAGEFYCLPVFACAGLMWMASATDLVSIFVALELVTITFYVMVAFMRRNVGSLEAGVKYLILGALSTGFLVYGIAWVYGSLGTTNIAQITELLNLGSIENLSHLMHNFAAQEAAETSGIYEITRNGALVNVHVNYPFSKNSLLFGLALIIIALGFKVGAAPMQLWIPDVYQGAPTPISAFLSVASKAAGFGVAITILRPFLADGSPTQAAVATILVVMAAATLLYGNLSALAQSNFKRLLAYSSIAHAGFLLLGMATGEFEHVLFYLAVYLIMTFAAFFILAVLRSSDDSEEISALDGLGKRNPTLALALTIIMAGMAGVPLTAGFWGKFFIFSDAVSNIELVSWPVIIIAFIGAAAGFYYYFKVIRAIYWNQPTTDEPLQLPFISKAILIVLTAAIILFGIFPKPLECLIG